jgi:RNA polymerase sigma-70 factor (ECF subfamily)
MLRIVVRVNEIVQDAWMVRLARVHLFEQLCGLPLSLESLRPFRNRAQDGQSIKQLRLVIRIFGIDGRHGVAVVVFVLVRELPADQRRVLELRFMEEKSTREVAEVLQRSEGAIKQLQFRGLENLRAMIGGKYA